MIYSFFYRSIQNFIKSTLQKKNFSYQLVNYINQADYKEIHDVGCSDGELAGRIDLNINKRYYGYDVDYHNVIKAKKKFKYNKNANFQYKSIDQIRVSNNKKKIFIFKGVFHHLSDKQISFFLSKLSKDDQVIALDPFFHKNISIIGYIMKKLDNGKFIRDEKNYRKILKGFLLLPKVSYYLRFYSHLLSYKNIPTKIIKKYF